MPLPGTSQIVECTIVGEMAGQRILNTYHYVEFGGDLPATLVGANQMADDFNAIALDAAGLLSVLNPAYTLIRTTAQLIYPTRFVQGHSAAAAPAPGTRAGTPMASSTQWSVTTLSDAAGPGGHGGNRYAGLNIGDEALSLLTPAFILLAIDAVAPLYATMNLAGNAVFPIIYKRADPLSSNQIVDFDVEREVRTMRRRVVGRGI